MGNTNKRSRLDHSMTNASWVARQKIRKSRKAFLETLETEYDTSNYIGDNTQLLCSISDEGGRGAVEDVAATLGYSDSEEEDAPSVDPRKYKYPFENIVLEGGGAKGVAHCGVFRALEQCGMGKQIHKFAGASVGALGASFLSVGYNSYDVEILTSVDFEKLLKDACCGYFSLIPNVLKYFGWNPGQKFLDYLGRILAAKTGNKDITFAEVFQKYGNELCIVVTNVNTMTEEYCHVKTTPDMPVRLAVRMSMSIPGVFQAVKHGIRQDTSYFVDGGLLCNYPIHCFDGWWLSLAQEDSFLHRINKLKNITGSMDHENRFTFNRDFKTIGCLVYSQAEQEYFKDKLEKKSGVSIGDLPDTKLAREWTENQKTQKKSEEMYSKLTGAVEEFCKVLDQANINDKSTITIEEFTNAFNADTFSKEQRTLLFGKDCDPDLAFAAVDKDGCGTIRINDIVHFIEESGFGLHEKYLGIARSKVRSLLNFVFTMFTGLVANANKMYLKDRDAERSIGVNTRHVTMLDFSMEDEDKKYLIEQGIRSTTKYLKHFVKDHDLEEVSKDEMKSRVVPCGPSLSEMELDRLLKI